MVGMSGFVGIWGCLWWDEPFRGDVACLGETSGDERLGD